MRSIFRYFRFRVSWPFFGPSSLFRRRSFPRVLQFSCWLCVLALCATVSFAQSSAQFVSRQDPVGSFAIPDGAAVDVFGNLYVTDIGLGAIRKVDPFGNQTSVGGVVGPWDVAVDSAGNIYFTFFSNNCVNKIPSGGGSTVCLGTGLSGPTGIAVDSAGNVYVADSGNSRVVEIAAGGMQSTLASSLSGVTSVAVDHAGNVYVAAAPATTITKIPAGGGSATTVGSGLTGPQGVAVDAQGNVFVCQSNNTVAEITPSGVQTTLPIAGLSNPLDPAVDAHGNLYVPNRNNGQVVVFNSAVATLGSAEACVLGQPTPCTQTATLNFTLPGGDSFPSPSARTQGVSGLDFSVVDNNCSGDTSPCHVVVQFAPTSPGLRSGALVLTDTESNEFVVPLSGTGSAADVAFSPAETSPPLGSDGFSEPVAVAVDGNGILNGNLYITDDSNCQIYKLPQSGIPSIFAGSGTCGFS